MIKMIDTPISVKPLVDNFRQVLEDNFNLAYRAWMNSRPMYKGTLEDIVRNDVPVTDFVRIPLEMTIPNFLREIIVSPRDHVVWSSTTRANPLHEAWPVYSPEVYDYSSLANSLISLKAQGARQDEFRMVLPLGYCGVFSANLSVRTLVKISQFLLNLYQVTLCKAFSDLANELGKIFNNTVITINNKEYSLDKLIFEMAYNYENANYLPEYKIHKNDKLGFNRVGSLVTWQGKASLGLRTHIIRHRSVVVSDNLLEIYKEAGEAIPLINLNREVELQATATQEIWDHVIGTRNCWIAQASLWQSMVNDYAKFQGKTRSPLPCDSELKCPYGTDNNLRLEGKDPNPVCSRYVTINNIKISSKMKEEIESYGKSRAEWWNSEFRIREEFIT